MSERIRFEQSKFPTAIRELGIWKSHSQKWSAMSPNRVTVGAAVQSSVMSEKTRVMFLGVQVEYNGYKVKCSWFRTREENYCYAWRTLRCLVRVEAEPTVSYFKEY